MSKKNIVKYEAILDIPEGLSIKQENNVLVVEGPKGKLTREFFHPRINITIEDSKVKIIYEDDKIRRKIKALVNTWKAHIRNMIKGVKDGFEYKLKIFYTHFPMSVKVEGNKVVISNFLGEKGNRYAEILEGVSVDIKGDEIFVRGIDKEKVGQTAANMELATKDKGGRDPRKFADGIYIVHKDK